MIKNKTRLLNRRNSMIPISLKITHNAGFFSCCSQVLEKLVDFRSKYGDYPKTLDLSLLFSLYKTNNQTDISHLFFKENQGNSNETGSTFFNNDLQFLDYQLLDFKNLSPLLKKYFTPSDLVEKSKKLLISKYSIEPKQLIAVYRRGLDKRNEIPCLPSTGQWHEVINAKKQQNPDLKLLVISDEKEFVDECRSKYSNIIAIDEVIGLSHEEYKIAGYAFHKRYREDFILDFLATILIISECEYIITSSCNVGLWIALFRGGLERVYQFKPKSIIKDNRLISTSDILKLEPTRSKGEARNFFLNYRSYPSKIFGISKSIIRKSKHIFYEILKNTKPSYLMKEEELYRRQKLKAFAEIKFSYSYVEKTICGDILVIEHNGGFFSCCSQMLQHICDYIQKHQRLPDKIDGSGLFFWYKIQANEDIIKTLFLATNQYECSTKQLPYFCNEMQYIDYRKIPIREIQFVIQRFFRPSSLVKEKVEELQKKYKIKPDNTIAVFYRGNDKQTETVIGNYAAWYDKLIQVKEKNAGLDILIQTDENEFLEFIRHRIPSIKVIEELPRINKSLNSAVHSSLNVGCETSFAISFLAATHILAKCNMLITHSGNCGMWACLFRGNSNNVVQYLNGYWCGAFHEKK